MKNLVLAALLVIPLPSMAADVLTPRVFDIVPPEGRQVEMVDGLTVLRQQGTRFGAVLTFMPESGVSAWIPIAVLNSSDGDLDVGTRHVSARYGDTALKVWSTTALVREATRRRDDMIAAAGGNGGTLQDQIAYNDSPNGMGRGNSTAGGRMGAMATGGPDSRGRNRARRGQAGSNDEYRARELADRQLAALKDSLFKDEEIAPRTIARGDVKIDLPPRRADGQPTEFVLTLAFGGETMDVLYRERDGSSVDVGDVTVPAAPAADETVPATDAPPAD